MRFFVHAAGLFAERFVFRHVMHSNISEGGAPEEEDWPGPLTPTGTIRIFRFARSVNAQTTIIVQSQAALIFSNVSPSEVFSRVIALPVRLTYPADAPQVLLSLSSSIFISSTDADLVPSMSGLCFAASCLAWAAVTSSRSGFE